MGWATAGRTSIQGTAAGTDKGDGAVGNGIEKIMRYPRNVLSLFAVLDGVLFLHLAGVVAYLPGTVSGPGLVLFQLLTLSLVGSVVGLGMGKRWGVIVSYVQFPFRFLCGAWSFGFLLQGRGLSIPDTLPLLAVLVSVLECGRLVWTILIHRRLFKK